MGKIVQVARFTADGSAVSREFKNMGDAGQQMSQRVQQGARGIPPAMRAVDSAAGQAKQGIDRLAGSAGGLGQVLTSLGPGGLAAAAAIGGLALAFGTLGNASRNAVRDLAAIDNQARRLGVSATALQEYRFAMIGVGQAAETADAALNAFNERLGEATLQRSGAGYRSLQLLGFSDDEISRMRSIEDALPRIAERLEKVADAGERTRLAKELGLDPFLAVLAQGEGAMARAREAAQQMGYVLDESLIRRAGEFNAQWEQASRVIDLQLKGALVDLAPTFVSIASAIAGASTALGEFVDRLREAEEKSTRGLFREMSEMRARQRALIAQHGADIAEGGDAARGALLDSLPAVGLTGMGARDRYAYYAQRGDEMQRILGERARAGANAAASGASSTAPTLPGAPDPALAQMRAFVDAIREEARAREDLARIMSANDNLSRDEAERIRQQQNDLARLNELRAAGVIRSDEELRQLQAMRIGRDEHAASLKREAELREKINQVMRDAEQRRSNVVAFERAQETPQERIRREIGEAEAMRSQGASDEAVQRRIAALNREYRDLAQAQWDASIAGQALSAAVQGQIRSWDDLGRVMISLLADSAIRALLTGMGGDAGGGGNSGGGGFWSGFASSFFSSMFGGGGGGASGGGRAGGGRTQPGARHRVAEQGPELVVTGGWGDVLPNGTFEALADLARVVQQAQRAPAASSGGGGRMDVTINNQASDIVDVRAEERQRADGMQQLSVTLTRKTGADIASGEHDAALGGRYRLRGPRTQRG